LLALFKIVLNAESIAFVSYASQVQLYSITLAISAKLMGAISALGPIIVLYACRIGHLSAINATFVRLKDVFYVIALTLALVACRVSAYRITLA
jgi:hypothetical protein